MRGYYRSWWDPHFQWQKHTDELTKTPGFLAVHMAVHFYIQDRDLDKLITNWKDDGHFAEFIEKFPEDAEYTADKLASEYFAQAKNTHKAFCAMARQVLTFGTGRGQCPCQIPCQLDSSVTHPTGFT